MLHSAEDIVILLLIMIQFQASKEGSFVRTFTVLSRMISIKLESFLEYFVFFSGTFQIETGGGRTDLGLCSTNHQGLNCIGI